jgi:predicted dehydrogenase
MRFGVIGAGNISQTHARAVTAVAGCTVAAVHGRNLQRARALADEYGAAAFDSLNAFLEHPMDAVIIGSPSGLHADQGCAAAERGLHVLVEKPIDVTAEAADRLMAACARAAVRLGVLFQDRTRPSFKALHDLLLDGRIGQPRLASARVKWYRPATYYSGSSWRGTWALDGGGALMNQGIHTLDLLIWLLGSVRRVTAQTATLVHRIEVEDTALALLEFENGARASFEATTIAKPGYPRQVELTTTSGTIRIEGERVVAVDLEDTYPELLADESPSTSQGSSSPVVANVDGHRALVEDFVRSVQTGKDPLCGGADARVSVAVANAIYESARTGCSVAT